MLTKSNKRLFPVGIGAWDISSQLNPDSTDPNYGGVEPLRGNEESEIEAIRYSISRGQNHIDCAEIYGGFYTDEVIGRAIAGLQREDLYLGDKLWKNSVGAGKVRPTVKAMLKKLGTNYLDMLYIHAPWDDVDWSTAISQIDDLIDEGLVRHFGVSNFTLEDMVKANALARHSLSANQVNYNVLHKDEVSPDFRGYCNYNQIQLIAYQPIKRQEVLHNTIIQKIALDHASSAAQIALAWLIQDGALPIPKSTNKQHIDENVDAVNVLLTKDEIELLNSI